MPNSNSQRGCSQMLASPTSKPGRDREELVALLRVRARPECLEGNLRELG